MQRPGTRLVTALLMATLAAPAAAQRSLSPMEELGKQIFFDENLSLNGNQSCATCHAPQVGWTGPDAAINSGGSVYEGSIPGAFGDRKPPSAAYAGGSPILHQTKQGVWVGGMFWDGRATGGILGDPLSEQAQGPFLNPAEQALAIADDVVAGVCASSYAGLFAEVWGPEACADPAAYDYIGFSVAAYERSAEVSPFTSTFDAARKGKAKLSTAERRGFALFQGKGKCVRCHLSNGQQPLFTDFTYDNLGVPKNPENPAFLADPTFVDPGLAGYLEAAGYAEPVFSVELGKFKVPTLRNVDKRPYPEFVKAFAHNGYFKSLEGIVHFYNTRDILPECPGDYTEAEALDAGCWPPPEVAANLNTAELGNLGLSPAEEADLVAFLKTLSDLDPLP